MIFGEAIKYVALANGTFHREWYQVKLMFKGLSKKYNRGNIFKQYNNYLLSVGKVYDDGNVSIFTREEVTVHKEEDILITCKGKPILAGVGNKYG